MKIVPGWCKVFLIILNMLSPPNIQAQDITSIKYWFDSQGESNATEVNFTHMPDVAVDFNIPLSGISFGIHMIHLETKDAQGRWSQISHILCCRDQLAAPSIVNVEYFLDGDPGNGAEIPVSFMPGANVTDVAFTLDLNTIPKGLHHLFIRGQDANGTWSMTQDQVIVCEPTNQNITSAEYFFDSDPGT